MNRLELLRTSAAGAVFAATAASGVPTKTPSLSSDPAYSHLKHQKSGPMRVAMVTDADAVVSTLQGHGKCSKARPSWE